MVAYDIAKIYIWKQITTYNEVFIYQNELLMILQRYTFGSKSQRFQNKCLIAMVAYDIAKIYIWKQITTNPTKYIPQALLLMILQRYTFGSKSQQGLAKTLKSWCCLWYCKDIHLEANHNYHPKKLLLSYVAYDIAKIYIWKQITTRWYATCLTK